MQSPSARRAPPSTSTRQNLITKQKVDITLRGGESLAEADFQKRNVKFMYADPAEAHFLDEGNYEHTPSLR